MKNYRRTNLYVQPNLWDELKKLAHANHHSVSEFVREVLWGFVAEKKKKAPDWKNDPLNKIVGAIEGPDGDWSVNHDYYLYGAPKKSKRP